MAHLFKGKQVARNRNLLSRAFASSSKAKPSRHTPLGVNILDLQVDDSTNKQKRTTAYEDFKVLTREVIPKVESTIEEKLLNQYANSLSSIEERQELLAAYNRRKKILADEEESSFQTTELKEEEKLEVDPAAVQDAIKDRDGYLSGFERSDIGRFSIVPETMVKELMPTGFYGKFQEDHVDRIDLHGLMCKEEAFHLTEFLKWASLPKDRKLILDLEELAETTEREGFAKIKSLLHHEPFFHQLFQEFSTNLWDRIERTGNKQLRKIFDMPAPFDALVTVLIRETRKNVIGPYVLREKDRLDIIDQVLDHMIRNLPEKINPHTANDIFQEFSKVRLSLRDPKDNSKVTHNYYLLLGSKYKNVFQAQWRPDEIRSRLNKYRGINSGALLHGPRGSGKSQILSYVSLWAKQNGWIVMDIPDVSKYLDGENIIVRHNVSGLYLQPDLTIELLKDFKLTNLSKLEKVRVRPELYGKFSMAGVHDDEEDPNPVVWLEDRKVWSNDWEQFVTDDQRSEIKKIEPIEKTRLGEFLKEPKTVLDIVNFGIGNEDYALNALAEALHQLYNTEDAHFLMVVDQYNEFFKPSKYPSFRYANFKELKTHIPPYHIALCRALMKFDGHKIKNGFKLCSTWLTPYFNHKVTPEQMMVPKEYGIEVQPLQLNDFRRMCNFYMATKYVPYYVDPLRIERKFTESQGNFGAGQDSLFGIDGFMTDGRQERR